MQRYAGVGRRALATAIDLLVLGLLVTVLFVVFGQPATRTTVMTNLDTGARTTIVSSGLYLTGWPTLLAITLWACYRVGMEAAFGATLGKMAVGIRVLRRDGAPIGLGEAIVRFVLRPIDLIGFYLVGALSIWFSARGQRLGDRAAGTVVVDPRLLLPGDIGYRPSRSR